MEALPSDWRSYPAPTILKQLGTDWVRSLSSLVLEVPAAVNPVERNLLLNPAHPEMRKLKIQPSVPFHFDPRMFGK